MNHLDTIQTEIAAGSLFVVNHSGGKDSQAMTALLAGLLPAAQVLVVHAELPGADWEGIPAHIEATVPANWTVAYCRAVHLDGTEKTFFSMVERRFESRPDVPSFPSPSQRTCTSDLKRGPIEKLVKRYLRDNPRFGGRAIFIDGRRAEESPDREKLATYSSRKRMNQAGRDCYDWLPIHDLTERQVRQVVADAGQELHPAYAAGMSRLSCCFCIMANKKDLATAAALRPELAAKYIALEVHTGYTMSMSRRPLSEIIADAGVDSASFSSSVSVPACTDSPRQISLKGFELTGSPLAVTA